MKKIVIIVGACCYNRGSEAMVRGTVSIIKKHIPDSTIVVSSSEDEFGPQLNIKGVDEYVKRFSYGSKLSVKKVFSVILRRFLKAEKAANKIRYKNLLYACKNADIVLVTGGDNYDKSYGMFSFMNAFNQLLRDTTKGKIIMYNCSLDQNEIDANVKNDFKLFDVITARESLTFNAFKEAFAGQDIYYYPDPAFAMESAPVDLPEGFVEGEMIGINVSSMVVEEKYGSNKATIISAYIKLIQHILLKTEYSVVLVPHVMKRLDLRTLEELYSYFTDDSRVKLITNESYNAAELKYIISKCKFFIGARTHSTIAAYSSQVPTLVLGYSVKSIGIATDIFGTEKGYVIQTKDLESESSLADAFNNILDHEEDIRAHLNSFMPGYIEKAWCSGALLEKL